MAALLSSVMGDHGKLAQYIREMKARDIPIYPPSVNKSGLRFITEGDGIRFGLLAVKNVGVNAVKELIEQRGEHRYKDLFDLCARVSLKTVNRRALESLIFAGGMDEFGIDRASLIHSLTAAIKYGESVQEKINNGQIQWFEKENQKRAYEQVPPLGINEKLKYEKAALGFYLSAHPLERYRNLLENVGHSEIHDLASLPENHRIRVAGMVAKARIIRTKKGDQMAFLTLSDESGETEIIVFPKLYNRNPLYFEKDQFLLVEGSLQKEEQTVKLIADKAIPLEQIKNHQRSNRKETLYIKFELRHQRPETMEKVKELLQRFRGNTEVILYYEHEKKTLRLPASFNVNPSRDCLSLLRRQLGANNVVLKQ
jgi:DNA polymerase-3 subunit alpha